MKQRWRNATLVTPEGEAARDLLVDGDRIAGLIERHSSSGEDWQDIDATGKVIFPGIIDLLQHGLDVNLYNDTLPGCVAHSSSLLLARGVTGFLPSISCLPPDQMEGTLNRLSAETTRATGARALGVHIYEGVQVGVVTLDRIEARGHEVLGRHPAFADRLRGLGDSGHLHRVSMHQNRQASLRAAATIAI